MRSERSTTPLPTVVTQAQPKSSMLREFVIFAFIGGMGAVVNLGVFVFCMKVAGFFGVEASLPIVPNVFWDFSFRVEHVFIILAFVLANFFNFALNSRVNFKNQAGKQKSDGLKFLIIGTVACFVQIYLFSKFTQPGPLNLASDFLDGSTGLRNPKYWAQALSIVLATPVNFIGNKLWTFR
ncbi:GtrA family protein [Corynebacterium camporealensis]